MKGTVIWFNDAKGYGFINSPEFEGDIFVHYSSIEGDGFKTLVEGQSVEFMLQENRSKLPEAFNVYKGGVS